MDEHSKYELRGLCRGGGLVTRGGGSGHVGGGSGHVSRERNAKKTGNGKEEYKICWHGE